MSRRAASEWGCIVSGIIAVCTAMVWIFGIQPKGLTLGWFPVFSILAALACAVLFYLGKRLPSEPQSSAVSTAGLDAAKIELNKEARERGIYLGATGTTAQIITDNLDVRVVIFSCSEVKLQYIRATLHASSVGELTLESSEPHRIAAFTEFEKLLRLTPTAEQTEALRKSHLVAVHVIAKFQDDIEKQRSFGVNLLT